MKILDSTLTKCNNISQGFVIFTVSTKVVHLTPTRKFCKYASMRIEICIGYHIHSHSSASTDKKRMCVCNISRCAIKLGSLPFIALTCSKSICLNFLYVDKENAYAITS